MRIFHTARHLNNFIGSRRMEWLFFSISQQPNVQMPFPPLNAVTQRAFQADTCWFTRSGIGAYSIHPRPNIFDCSSRPEHSHAPNENWIKYLPFWNCYLSETNGQKIKKLIRNATFWISIGNNNLSHVQIHAYNLCACVCVIVNGRKSIHRVDFEWVHPASTQCFAMISMHRWNKHELTSEHCLQLTWQTIFRNFSF